MVTLKVEFYNPGANSHIILKSCHFKLRFFGHVNSFLNWKIYQVLKFLSTGIPCFLKVWVRPLDFYKRPVLVPVFH